MSSGPSLLTSKFYSVQQTPGTSQYTIVDGFDFPYTISDRSDGPNDNLSILAASGQDTVQLTNANPGASGTATYVGRTSNEGDIFVFSGGQISLLSNNTYQVGTSLTLTTGSTVLCFASGTAIRTDRGDVAVEMLKAGDVAVTSTGAHRRIRWIGSRRISCRNHPDPAAVMPVRIRAGALGENRPVRDLVVSPGHAICLDVVGEVLIHASRLVNGSTIVQEAVDKVTYWHIELDGHDILIAEGQPAESYLDMGNRGFFEDGRVVELGATPDASAVTRTLADFCRPFVDGGVVLDAVRAQVRARAERLGWHLETTPWAEAHLLVDGRRVEADIHGFSARFAVPPSARDVWLISRTGVPCEISANPDPRRLGLCLQAIAIDDGAGERRSVSLGDPLLRIGFHDLEAEGMRWTTGRSMLPAALFEGCGGTVHLHLDLVGPALPRWVAAEADAAAERPYAVLGRVA